MFTYSELLKECKLNNLRSAKQIKVIIVRMFEFYISNSKETQNAHNVINVITTFLDISRNNYSQGTSDTLNKSLLIFL